MGDIADYYEEIAMMQMAEEESMIEELYKSYREGRLIWNTQNGDEILISKMTDSHVYNSIAYLKRQESSDYIVATIDILQQELIKRKL